MSKNVDFNLCHGLWRSRSIDLEPVTLDITKWWVYYTMAIPAMVFNICLVLSALNRILRRDIHETEIDGQTPIWNSDSKLSSAVCVFSLVSTLLTAAADSLFDGLYFIKLKTVDRLIHVPTAIHVV